ncbi:MAG TPA: HipA family kinase [Polyangiaceae bacterium]
MLPRFDARRVLGRLLSGSSSPVVVETDGGRFVAKLRGSGDGVPALVAEIIVGELAAALGLAVPERVLIELPEGVASDDRNDELADLLARSAGTNVGLRFLEGARAPRAEELERLDDAFVTRVLLLDDWVMNPDRTAANPNLLLWKQQPWLIDHGAALGFHHDWGSLTEDSPREPLDQTAHVFARRRPALEAAFSACAKSIPREALAKATARVPDVLLPADIFGSAFRTRAAYEAFLWRRLKFVGQI